MFALLSDDAFDHYNGAENLFIKHCQGLGILPMDFEALGETRGGDRSELL